MSAPDSKSPSAGSPPADSPPDSPHVEPPRRETRESRDRALQRMLFAAAFVVVLAGVKASSTFIVPLLLGCFLAIITWPLVALVRRTRLPDSLGIFLVLTVIIGILIGIGAAVVASASGFIQNSDKYADALTERFGGVIAKVGEILGGFGYDFDVNELQSSFDPGMLFGQLSNVLTGVGAAVTSVFFVLILLSFIIVEISILPKKLESITTSDDSWRRFDLAVGKIQTYILVKTGLSVVTACITGIATFAVGVPYAGLWMLLTFVLNYVPAFGSILAAVPPILLALLLISWPAALIVAGVYLAVNFLIDNMVEPRLMGHTLGLSPLVVFVSLVFWGWLLGPIGMPLSTPLTMIVKIMLSDSKQFGWIAVLLGNGEKEGNSDDDDPHKQIPAMRYVSQTIRASELKVDPDAMYKPSEKATPLAPKA